MLKSFKSSFNQTITQLACANARYSASAEDHEIVACFLDLQLTIESPKNMQKPVMDRLVSGQVAQSESLYPLSCSEDFEAKRIPCPIEPLR